MYTQKIANIFDHIQDHSRVELENKFWENKSRRLFCVRQVYFTNCCQHLNLGVFKPTFYNFYTSHLRWNSTIYHTDLGQNRLRVVPHFPSGIVERAKRERAWITPREKRRHACRLFSRGVIFTPARVSLALLSLRKNGGLLVVYGQNAVFHNFSRLIALSQYSGRSIVGFKRNRWKISKNTHTASWFSFL